MDGKQRFAGPNNSRLCPHRPWAAIDRTAASAISQMQSLLERVVHWGDDPAVDESHCVYPSQRVSFIGTSRVPDLVALHQRVGSEWGPRRVVSPAARSPRLLRGATPAAKATTAVLKWVFLNASIRRVRTACVV